MQTQTMPSSPVTSNAAEQSTIVMMFAQRTARPAFISNAAVKPVAIGSATNMVAP